jgi:hypothetical protein
VKCKGANRTGGSSYSNLAFAVPVTAITVSTTLEKKLQASIRFDERFT